jgi:uncharacterized membrane protein YphA (DoxX/SURF4 family)
LWHAVVPWVGKHVLHLSHPITIWDTGSGDTTYDYVQALCVLTLAVVATLVWSILDRRRANYERLHQWLVVYLRFALAAIMMAYGSAKVINDQFPAPSLSRLFTTYGDSTPMSLLWTFMGASKSYTIFAGAIEMLGGALLIVPRLTTLGALVCAGAMSNVFVLNMSYDVDVKLFSFHLLLIAGVLLLPNLRRLADFLVLNRSVEALMPHPLFQRRWLNRGALVFQVIFGTCMAASLLHSSYHSAVTQGELAPKPPFYGIWTIEEFSIQGEDHDPAVPARWQRIFFDNYSVICMESINGRRHRFYYGLDKQKNTLTLWDRETPETKNTLTVAMLPADMIGLDGILEGRHFHARLHRSKEPKFLLTNHRFHWISEYPFNGFNDQEGNGHL